MCGKLKDEEEKWLFVEKNGSWSNWKDGKQVSQTQQRFHGAIAGDNRHTEADLSFLNATTVGEAKDGILL